jgi:two-component system sensor histidine kinase QseC
MGALRVFTSQLSLQTRLLILVLGLVGLVWVAVAVSTWYDTEHELDELLDAHLSQAASLLVTRSLDDLEGDNLPAPPSLHKYQARVAFQVWHQGRLVVRSANAPDSPLGHATAPGLSRRRVSGADWVVLTTPGREPGMLVCVGELESARRHIQLASLRSVVWPMVLALPLLALGIWWSVRASVRPLNALGRGVASRHARDLEPLSAAGVPPEVRPLVEALNTLFGRIAALLASERRFTADAAHELRTPIAAIRIQAQVAQGAQDEESRARALAATVAGCDRAKRLVEQLLQLARLEGDADSAGDGADSCDLAAVAQLVLAELEAGAHARRQELVLDNAGPVVLPLSPPLAEVLLRNLVDNALRYSPAGACVRVAVIDAPVPALVVEDSGPGMPEDTLARLGERFFRVPGTGQEGSGLGWSIVQRIARLYRLGVNVDRSPWGGLRVAVTWEGGNRGRA